MGKNEEPKTRAPALNRNECTRLVLALAHIDRADVDHTATLAGALGAIVIARTAGRGLGPTVDTVLRKLLDDLSPK